MKKNKKQTIGLNLILLLGVFALVFYLLRASMGEIVQELKQTPLIVILSVTLLGIFYQLVEGYNIKKIGEGENLSLTILEGTVASCYAAFIRVITFGAGTVLAEIWYYHKKNLATPFGIGLTLLRMIFYKIALLIWGVVGLLTIGPLLFQKQNHLFLLAILGMVGTFLVIAFLLALACSLFLQTLLVKLAFRFLKSKKWQDKFDHFNLQIYALREFFNSLLKNKPLFMKVILINLFKVSLWLIVPSLVLKGGDFQSFILYFFLTDFAVLTAGILPAPAGMGSLEFIFLLLFPVFITKGQSVSALLLFRFASYLLPFLMGFIFSIGMKEHDLKLELNDK